MTRPRKKRTQCSQSPVDGQTVKIIEANNVFLVQQNSSSDLTFSNLRLTAYLTAHVTPFPYHQLSTDAKPRLA